MMRRVLDTIKASKLYKFGPTSLFSVSFKDQLLSNFSTVTENIYTIFFTPSNNNLNLYKLITNITKLIKILK